MKAHTPNVQYLNQRLIINVNLIILKIVFCIFAQHKLSILYVTADFCLHCTDLLHVLIITGVQASGVIIDCDC